MPNEELGSHSGMGDIRVGNITDSEAVAIGHDAIAVKTTGDVTIYQGPAYPRLNYRSDVAHLLQFYTQTFVGRESEWDHLAAFASQKATGYLLVEAPPGYGKSALMAQIVHRHETHRWEHGPVSRLVYFFVRQQEGRNTPVSFLQAINSQLLELLQLPGGVPIDLAALRAQFSQLWARAKQDASAEQPLLLLVDSLDEMATGNVTVAQLLPTDLAPYTHVIVASRPNPDPAEQVALEHPLRRADLLRLNLFDEANIRVLLQEYGTAIEVAASLAPRVQILTRGEPLFARFVCQQAAVEGEVALAHLEKQPPADVEDYFRQQLGQLESLAESDLTWSVLGLLTVAVGGMTVDEMAEVLGVVQRRKARQAVEPIQRFLLGETRLELMHAQLRKVLSNEFSPAEQAGHRQKLLEWCKSYQARQWPPETPAYIVRNYARHLELANAPSTDFYALVCKEWLEAWQTVDGTSAGFLTDVNRAWARAEAEGPTALGQQVLDALCWASVASLSAHIGNDLLLNCVRAGVITPRLGLVTARQKPDPQKRAECLARLTEYLPSAEFAPVMHEALSAARAIGNEWVRPSALIAVAERLPETERVEVLGEAVAAARAIGADEVRANALIEVAARLPETEQAKVMGEALAAARAMRIEYEAVRASTLGMVAAWLPAHSAERAEVWSEALAAARAIGDERLRAQALRLMAGRLPETEQALLGQVLAVARAIENDMYRAETLSAVAKRLPLAERVAVLGEAVTAAERLSETQQAEVLGEALAACAIGDEESRTDAMSAVAAQLPETEEVLLGAALAAARAIGDEPSRASVLSAAAERLPEPEHAEVLGAALAAACAIGDEASRAQAMSAVAARLPETERADVLGNALAVARAIEYEGYRAQTLIAVAVRLPEAEQAAVLGEALAAARAGANWSRAGELIAVADRLPETERAAVLGEALVAARADADWPQAWAVRDVAKRLPKTECADVWSAALAAARAIGHEEARALALSAVAAQLPETEQGLLNEALAAARAMEDEGPRAETLSAVAERLPQAEQAAILGEALAIARTTGDEWFRAQALSAVAERLPETERVAVLGEALAAARAIRKERARAEILGAVAERLPETERAAVLGEALAVARAIGDERFRATALSRVVERLPNSLLAEALQATFSICNLEESTKILSCIAPHWQEMCQGDPRVEFVKVSATLRAFAKATRSQLLKVIEMLLPVIDRLGGPQAMHETAQTITKTARWWP